MVVSLLYTISLVNALLSDSGGGCLKQPLRWIARPSPLELHYPVGPASSAVVCAYLFPPNTLLPGVGLWVYAFL